jgi:hypothetical protein
MSVILTLGRRGKFCARHDASASTIPWTQGEKAGRPGFQWRLPVWVKRRNTRQEKMLSACLQQRTSLYIAAKSGSRRFRKSAASFDHLVGAGLQRHGHSYTKRLGGLGVDDQLELDWLLHWQVFGIVALADTTTDVPT